jgi:predicted Zn finger-like uncharacterized protein
MDVQCPKCSIEYEFDNEKITKDGVTVKCSSCGHIFKVRKTAVAASLPEPAKAEREWTVKRKDGRKIHFKELTTLQKWIVEQKVSREDLISKTGQSWKSLGDIAELDSFFQVVDAANMARGMTPLGSGRKDATSPTGISRHGDVRDELAAPSAQETREAVDAPNGRHHTHQHVADEPADFQDQLGGYPPDAIEANLSALDLNDPVMQWRKGDRSRRFAALATGGLIVAGILLYVVQPKLFDPIFALMGTSDPQEAQNALMHQEVSQLIRADSFKQIEEAVASHEKKLVADSSNPHLHISLARIFAAQSMILNEKIRLGEQTKAPQKQIDSMKAKQSDAANKSKGHAQKAVSMRGDLALSFIASAASKSQNGESYESDLAEAAKRGQSDPSAVNEATALRILLNASISLKNNKPGEISKIRNELTTNQHIVTADRRMQYADLSLQVALLLAGDKVLKKASILAQLEAFGRAGNKTGRVALLRMLTQSGAQAKSTAAKGNNETQNMGTQKASDGSPHSRAQDYQRMLTRAKRARISDRSQLAYTLYKQAAAYRPRASAPYVGMGWSLLDLGESNKAVSAFKKALQRSNKNSEAQFGLGESLRGASRNQAALRAFKRYIELAPGGPDAADARRAIEQLSR